jgi:hypothetical protein
MRAHESVQCAITLCAIIVSLGCAPVWAQMTPDLRRLIGRPQQELVRRLGAPARIDRLHGGSVALNYRGAAYRRYQVPCVVDAPQNVFHTVCERPPRIGCHTEIRPVTPPPICLATQLVEVRCQLSVFVDRVGIISDILAYDWPCPATAE